MVRFFLLAMLASLVIPALPLWVTSAEAAIPMIEPKAPRALSDDDLAEIVDFVVSNAVFALYHQAGHMMMERYGANPKGVGDPERAADLFAITTLLDPRSGSGDQTLVDALDSWRLQPAPRLDIAADATRDDPHGLDAARADALGCDLVGADPKEFSDIADMLDFTVARRRLCGARWKHDHTAWIKALKRVGALSGGKAGKPFAVAYDPAEDADAAAAAILKDNDTLEEVAGRLASRLSLAAPPLIRAAHCGAPTTRFDAERNELVFCYERATADARLITDDIRHRD